MELTIQLANGKISPNVNTPTNGPPTMPNILKAACKTPPNKLAINAIPRQRTPYMIPKPK